ncbi:putative chitinase/lysozyme protein [Gregarina niphandrodes]|uniref:Chitinase/lysozyme protein n=1 Tax=Gregarina niphandrodes TaxID=110365 RepID=A0A023BDV1_GRENI|nr:putative chitinase/lysozyme protein [Gregarina niphandrodes]EZG89737.1 putative chitinase/lysozyme protein [Gregarina niphandrodes]|eukprot:XP_011128445.1 putative chitinase/lysozyme protein [Gregarina niphandrodes]
MRGSVAVLLLCLARGADVDCTGVIPWDETLSGNGPWKVHKDGVLYTSETWVDPTNVPGADSAGWSPWTAVGTCIAGTAGDGSEAAGTEDCTGVAAWSGATTYADPGQKVHSDHYLFQNKWNVVADKPDPKDRQSAWELLGKCVDGTDSTTTPDDGGGDATDYPDDMWEQTCVCCQGCSSIENGQVICTDFAQDKCYTHWCGDSASFDAETCETLKNNGTFQRWLGTMSDEQQCWPEQFYAPYFDAGLYGWPPLVEIAKTYGVNHFVVAFITSAQKGTVLYNGTCQGGFAGVMPVSAGPTYESEGSFYHLYDELNELRKMGGDFVVSFGGAMGLELADSPECQNGDPVANLAKEYGRILDQLNSHRIDFDIEGNAIGLVQKDLGWTYRFEAVKRMKEERNGKLQVIWTLPVAPDGLAIQGTDFIDLMMKLDAPFDLINVMNMDYGPCDVACPADQFGACERNAIKGLAQQMFDAAQTNNRLEQYGWTKVEDTYKVLASTPMIGLNDQPCLTYKFADAEQNVSYFKNEMPIRMLSMWSLTRDSPCSFTYADSNCSSYTEQTDKLQFVERFAKFQST